MALIDFLQSAEKITNTPAGADALATTDIVMAQAAKTQENRMRREELQRKIDNLRKQNDELKARRESLKASTSLSNLDEDKIVAIAKAKGIKDEDIDMWLRGRTARTNREISEGQKEELGKQAKAEDKKATAIEKANKDARKQAILDARNAYEKANKPVETEEYESKVSELDSLEFTFNNLKDSYEEDYDEKLDFTLTPRKVQATPADGAPKDSKIPPIPAGVELTADQRREWNKPTTTKDQRDKIIAQILDKKKAEAEEKAKKKSEQEEAEAEAKEKKKDEAMNRRAKIKADANNPNLSRAAKDALVARYRKTFADTDERTPSRTEAENELFGD
jgi:hypothetical protein